MDRPKSQNTPERTGRLHLILIAGIMGACSPNIGGEQFNNVSPGSSLIAVPHTSAEVRRFVEYKGPNSSADVTSAWTNRFLTQRLNRAFAVSSTSFGLAFGWPSAKEASDFAIKECERRTPSSAALPCTLYAVNAGIVYPGQQHTLAFRGQRLGPFTPSPEYVYHGPERAKGVIVWSHGTYAPRGYACGNNGAKFGASGFVNHFNQAGWDVVRFDRDPCQDDISTALRQLPAGIEAAAGAGYQKIVLAGQSRGAFHSLEFLRGTQAGARVHAVIAASPASSGKETGAFTAAPAHWRSLVDGLSGNTIIAVFFFSLDDYNPNADEQAQYARSVWSRTMPNARVYYDTDPSIVMNGSNAAAGHFGAGRPAFTDKYMPCLLTLIETGQAVGPCVQ